MKEGKPAGDLRDRVAIVTGAAAGIGLACVETLARHGAAVVGVDISSRKLAQRMAALTHEGLNAHAIPADISQWDQVSAMVKQVLEQFGRVDILVNNAGTVDDTPIGTLDMDRWNQVMAVNLLGHQLCTYGVMEAMDRQKYGRLVFVSSRAGQMGSSLVNPSYCASKAGCISLSKSYAHWGAARGVVSNGVAPAFIDTELVRGDGRVEDYPMKRLGTPQEVANVVYFLSSDLCSYVNGVTIEANGGQYIR